ncbi:hypothetical protein, conserved [Plasmodium malariae]|uniref:RNA-binding protein n=1 Tax=Plasmodium malariae TaxID=5858 RepID=A0A1A8WHN7_PLAMA|nr:hypothetical protein, conserved [Plasmodium malariae]
MSSVYISVIILSALFSFLNINIIRSYSIYGNLKTCKITYLNISKDSNDIKIDVTENYSMLEKEEKKKNRYSFSPMKRNSIKDIKRRMKYSGNNVKVKNSKFLKNKDINKILIDDINKERLKADIKAIGTSNINENLINQNILPLPVEEKLSPTYNCLVLCKGMPFHVDSTQIKDFFKPYKIIDKYIIFIKDKKGNFFGDVIVRFINKEQKYLAIKNKNYKFLLHRYIQLFNINEEHYEEYYNIGYKNPPSYKNYVPIKYVIVPNDLVNIGRISRVSNSSNASSSSRVGSVGSIEGTINNEEEQFHSFVSDRNYDDDEDTKELRKKINPVGILLKNIYTGKKLRGRITSVHEYGVFVDCDVYIKDKNNRFIKILSLLHKNKLTINIGLPSYPLHEQEDKELILQKNMNIIVYVDKIIKKQIDEEGEGNHRSEDYIDIVHKEDNELAIHTSDNSKDKKLIFFNLTLDSSITEEKIKWFRMMKLKRQSIQERLMNSNVTLLNLPSENEAKTYNKGWSYETPNQHMKKPPTKEEEAKKNSSENMYKNTGINKENMNNENSGNTSQQNYLQLPQNTDNLKIERSKLTKNVKLKKNVGNRPSKIYLMNNRNYKSMDISEVYNKVKKVKMVRCLKHNNGEKEEYKEEVEEKGKNKKNNSTSDGEDKKEINKSSNQEKGAKIDPKNDAKKKKKKEKIIDDTSLYDEYENYDDVFNVDSSSIETQEEVYEEPPDDANKDEDTDERGGTDSHDDKGHKGITKNRKIKKNVKNHYTDEMNSILSEIFSGNEETNNFQSESVRNNDAQNSQSGKNKKRKMLNVARNTGGENADNNGNIAHKCENTVIMKNFENNKDRMKWTNDIRKEESLLYSKLFGLKTDINDFYSNGTSVKDTSKKGKELSDTEEHIKLNEKESSRAIPNDEKENLEWGGGLGSSRKGDMNGGEEKGEEDEEEDRDKQNETNNSPFKRKLRKSDNVMISALLKGDSDTLDFSHFSDMSMEELKKEIYKRNFLLPVEISKDSLRNRLIQIYICEKKKIKFDNYPIIRYYLFDFHLRDEEMKLLILANRKFLNKKNINKQLLNTLDTNELKYLLHKSMEHFRLWEPHDSVKRKILNLNKDLLLKQNISNTDNIDQKNLIILWNDFKDFMLNFVYTCDDHYDTFENMNNLHFSSSDSSSSSISAYSNSNRNSNSNSGGTNEYISRMNNMEKENFFTSNNDLFNDMQEREINKNKDENKNSFDQALDSLNKHFEDNEVDDLPEKIDLKEAMKLLNNRTYLKKIKRFMNKTSDNVTDEDYIQKIIQHILKHKKYFKENLNEEILKKKPYEDLIVMLDQLPADLLEELF